MPMDKKITPELEITANLLEQSLKKESYPKPSVTSLEFIRNFARNFRVQKNVNGAIRELVLN